MAKHSLSFICSECGYKSAKWLGRCPECRAWSSFVEEVEVSLTIRSVVAEPAAILSIDSVDFQESERIRTGISELDRVLGGTVPGQVVLVSGQPGVGKSTLLLEVAHRLALGSKVFYVNGEESSAQVKSRALRLGVSGGQLFLIPDNCVENIVQRMVQEPPGVLVVDSIQTLFSERYQSLPGSVVQVRECSHLLVSTAKQLGVRTFVVSHITKSGDIAGPKVLEHVVDTVLFLETDARSLYRILRSLKNRFHSTDEVGFFQIEEAGMLPMEDPSDLFAQVHHPGTSGVTLFPHLEGSRVILIELQALVSRMQLSYPRRSAEGMDNARLSMLLAVMEKQLGLLLASADVYLNVTGGLTIRDPSLDLGVICTVYSSMRGDALPEKTSFVGEVGLAGELRPVQGLERRIRELARAGVERVIVPASGAFPKVAGVKLQPARGISEVMQLLGWS